MSKYEFMFIVRPTLDEAAIKKVADDMKSVITKSNGKIVDERDMGQRELAYEIAGHRKGYYFLFTVEADAKAVAEFNRVANVTEDVIRHLIIKIED